jgi:hypothetical protein
MVIRWFDPSEAFPGEMLGVSPGQRQQLAGAVDRLSG